MSLRERILIVLLVMLGCYAGMELLVLKQVITPELQKLEHQQAQASLQQCTDAIQKHLIRIQKDLCLLSKSGKLYSPAKSPSVNVTNAILSKLDLDFVTIYDNNWNRLACDAGPINAEELTKIFFDTEHPLIKKNIPGYSVKSLVYHEGQLLYIVSAPITQSSMSQTVEGTVMAGLCLTPARLEALRNQISMNVSLDFLNPDELVGQNKEIVERISDEQPFDLLPVGEKLLQASAVFCDYRKQPVLLTKIYQDRTISQESQHEMLMVLYAKITMGVIAVLLLISLLQRVVIKPILQLVKHIIDIEEHLGNSKNTPLLSRKDEIGTLANEFNQMCLRLQNAQAKLVEKSYLSGITEMSSGILHNVRNALSPITTRIERIKDQFNVIPLQNLEKAQTELQSQSLDTDRRKDLVRFVELTFQDVLMNLNEMVVGLDDLTEQVFQIESMLNLQRTFGRDDKPVEFVEPIELLDKAMEIIPQSVQDSCRISIDPKIKKLPDIPVEPTTFVQILQNLLINAAESLEREKPLYQKINIDADIETVEGQQMLHWIISDNGTGIPAEKIHQIFERGASSKRKGLTGIGLHWCANTITAMKGRIWAESKGTHHGACFHLLIPIAVEVEPVETEKEVIHEC